VVEAAVAKGRAVYCEKPLAPTLDAAERLVARVEAAGIVAQVGLVLRSAPVFRELKALLDSGRLGRPMTAVLRDDQYFPVQGMYASAWRGDVEMAGGGCLIEHSIHDVDILRFCLGEVDEVTARTAAFAGYPGIEDLAVVTMQHASGATSEIVSIWHQILTRGSTRRLEVFCERGLVWLDNEFVGPLHVETSEGAEAVVCGPAPWVHELPFAGDEVGLSLQTYAQADETFLRAVVSGRAAEPSFAEALVAHRLVDAAYRSAGSGGRPVGC
jgi:predicted dehydrogenase